MKAIIWTRYGPPDGLQLQELEMPVPKDNEVLVKVCAATAATPDTEFRRFKFPPLFIVPLRIYIGFWKPTRIRVLGTEFAGEIISTGKEVTRYKPGDQVYGYTGLRMGTYAEYICLPETPSTLASIMGLKPVNVTCEEAAAIPFGGLEALHGLSRVNVQRGQKVLIVGAGGSIGTYTVQLAKHHGAEVTGVDKPGKFEMLRSIGADYVIDYAREDFTRNGEAYDVIVDTIDKVSLSGGLRALKEGGTFLNANLGPMGGMRKQSIAEKNKKKLLPWTSGYTVENLNTLKELVEAGVIKPVIDRRYPLEQIVEAHRYVDSGQKKGNVVIIVQSPQAA